jgi:hypothetical protein
MARDGGSTATIEEGAIDSASASGDPPVDAELIQGQLREKEQLVTALTERLEQAAEQLDRLRRTGVDKGRRPLVGGFPSEVLENHKQTLEDLKRVIGQWEESQPGATLGRIETQIAELRDLLTGSSHAGAHTAARALPQPASQLPSNGETAPAPRPRNPEPVASHSGSKPTGNAWWEAQKAALLGEPVSPEVQAQLAAQSSAAGAEPEAAEPAESDTAGARREISIPDLPAPIDFETITLDDARTAIRERDRVIQQMREALLTIKGSSDLPADLQSLASLPEPVRARIAELEEQWQAKFRQVELDVSLERARLAREQAAVRQQQEMLQKQSRKGASSSRTASDEPAAKGDKGEDSASSKRRWFRFMGKGDEDASNSRPADGEG